MNMFTHRSSFKKSPTETYFKILIRLGLIFSVNLDTAK